MEIQDLCTAQPAVETQDMICYRPESNTFEKKGKIILRAQYGFSDLAYGKWDQMNTKEKSFFMKICYLFILTKIWR